MTKQIFCIHNLFYGLLPNATKREQKNNILNNNPNEQHDDCYRELSQKYPPSAHESFLFTSIAAAILRVNIVH